jgi:hypothetical protein
MCREADGFNYLDLMQTESVLLSSFQALRAARRRDMKGAPARHEGASEHDPKERSSATRKAL